MNAVLRKICTVLVFFFYHLFTVTLQESNNYLNKHIHTRGRQPPVQQYRLFLTWQTLLLESRNTFLWNRKGVRSGRDRKATPGVLLKKIKSGLFIINEQQWKEQRRISLNRQSLSPVRGGGPCPCSRAQLFPVLWPSPETKWQLLLCDVASPATKRGHGNKRISYTDDIVTQKLAQPMLLT